MGKINIGNITVGFDKVKTVTETLSNVSHFELVPIDFIEPAEQNPFADEDTDESRYEVAMSILANGLIEPLAVNKKAADKYKLISGEHRYTAIKQYLPDKFRNIPCMVFEGISDDEAELKLYEANSHRDYTAEQKFKRYQELERLLQKMKDAGTYHGGIQKGLAERLGVTTRQVRKYQTIAEKLTPEQQQSVIKGEMSINDACKSAAPKPDQLPQMTDDTDTPADSSKSGTSSAFCEVQCDVSPRRFKHYDHIYFIKQNEQNPNKFSAYFKVGDSEDIRLGSLPSVYDTSAEAQETLNNYAALKGYEEVTEISSNKNEIDSLSSKEDNTCDILQTEANSTSEINDPDNQFWNDKIRTAIKQHYDVEKLCSFYIFEVPTTQDAIKQILKPENGYSGGTIIFTEKVYGFCTCRSSQMEIDYDHKRMVLTFSQVDDFIRKMIRSGELLSKDEIKSVIEKQINKY